MTKLRALECYCKMKTGVEQHEEGDKVGTGIQWVGDVKIKQRALVSIVALTLIVSVLPMRVFSSPWYFPHFS